MKTRRPLAALLAACALTGLAAPALAQHADTRPAAGNAQEQAPEALLGAWQADIAASRYGGTPPAFNLRTFSYTDQGKVLVTSLTTNAQGRTSLLHWAVQLDGTPGLEFTSVNRSVPASLVGLKKEDDRTFVMTVWKHGEVDLKGTLKLSEDGQTLTYSYGRDTPVNVIVYRRWTAQP